MWAEIKIDPVCIQCDPAQCGCCVPPRASDSRETCNKSRLSPLLTWLACHGYIGWACQHPAGIVAERWSSGYFNGSTKPKKCFCLFCLSVDILPVLESRVCTLSNLNAIGLLSNFKMIGWFSSFVFVIFSVSNQRYFHNSMKRIDSANSYFLMFRCLLI